MIPIRSNEEKKFVRTPQDSHLVGVPPKPIEQKMVFETIPDLPQSEEEILLSFFKEGNHCNPEGWLSEFLLKEPLPLIDSDYFKEIFSRELNREISIKIPQMDLEFPITMRRTLDHLVEYTKLYNDEQILPMIDQISLVNSSVIKNIGFNYIQKAFAQKNIDFNKLPSALLNYFNRKISGINHTELLFSLSPRVSSVFLYPIIRWFTFCIGKQLLLTQAQKEEAVRLLKSERFGKRYANLTVQSDHIVAYLVREFAFKTYRMTPPNHSKPLFMVALGDQNHLLKIFVTKKLINPFNYIHESLQVKIFTSKEDKPYQVEESQGCEERPLSLSHPQHGWQAILDFLCGTARPLEMNVNEDKYWGQFLSTSIQGKHFTQPHLESDLLKGIFSRNGPNVLHLANLLNEELENQAKDPETALFLTMRACFSLHQHKVSPDLISALMQLMSANWRQHRFSHPLSTFLANLIESNISISSLYANLQIYAFIQLNVFANSGVRLRNQATSLQLIVNEKYLEMPFQPLESLHTLLQNQKEIEKMNPQIWGDMLLIETRPAPELRSPSFPNSGTGQVSGPDSNRRLEKYAALFIDHESQFFQNIGYPLAFALNSSCDKPILLDQLFSCFSWPLHEGKNFVLSNLRKEQPLTRALFKKISSQLPAFSQEFILTINKTPNGEQLLHDFVDFLIGENFEKAAQFISLESSLKERCINPAWMQPQWTKLLKCSPNLIRTTQIWMEAFQLGIKNAATIEADQKILLQLLNGWKLEKENRSLLIAFLSSVDAFANHLDKDHEIRKGYNWLSTMLLMESKRAIPEELFKNKGPDFAPHFLHYLKGLLSSEKQDVQSIKEAVDLLINPSFIMEVPKDKSAYYQVLVESLYKLNELENEERIFFSINRLLTDLYTKKYLVAPRLHKELQNCLIHFLKRESSLQKRLAKELGNHLDKMVETCGIDESFFVLVTRINVMNVNFPRSLSFVRTSLIILLEKLKNHPSSEELREVESTLIYFTMKGSFKEIEVVLANTYELFIDQLFRHKMPEKAWIWIDALLSIDDQRKAHPYSQWIFMTEKGVDSPIFKTTLLKMIQKGKADFSKELCTYINELLLMQSMKGDLSYCLNFLLAVPERYFGEIANNTIQMALQTEQVIKENLWLLIFTYQIPHIHEWLKEKDPEHLHRIFAAALAALEKIDSPLKKAEGIKSLFLIHQKQIALFEQMSPIKKESIEITLIGLKGKGDHFACSRACLLFIPYLSYHQDLRSEELLLSNRQMLALDHLLEDMLQNWHADLLESSWDLLFTLISSEKSGVQPAQIPLWKNIQQKIKQVIIYSLNDPASQEKVRDLLKMRNMTLFLDDRDYAQIFVKIYVEIPAEVQIDSIIKLIPATYSNRDRLLVQEIIKSEKLFHLEPKKALRILRLCQLVKIPFPIEKKFLNSFLQKVFLPIIRSHSNTEDIYALNRMIEEIQDNFYIYKSTTRIWKEHLPVFLLQQFKHGFKHQAFTFLQKEMEGGPKLHPKEISHHLTLMAPQMEPLDMLKALTFLKPSAPSFEHLAIQTIATLPDVMDENLLEHTLQVLKIYKLKNCSQFYKKMIRDLMDSPLSNRVSAWHFLLFAKKKGLISIEDYVECYTAIALKMIALRSPQIDDVTLHIEKTVSLLDDPSCLFPLYKRLVDYYKAKHAGDPESLPVSISNNLFALAFSLQKTEAFEQQETDLDLIVLVLKNNYLESLAHCCALLNKYGREVFVQPKVNGITIALLLDINDTLIEKEVPENPYLITQILNLMNSIIETNQMTDGLLQKAIKQVMATMIKGAKGENIQFVDPIIEVVSRLQSLDLYNTDRAAANIVDLYLPLMPQNETLDFEEIELFLNHTYPTYILKNLPLILKASLDKRELFLSLFLKNLILYSFSKDEITLFLKYAKDFKAAKKEEKKREEIQVSIDPLVQREIDLLMINQIPQVFLTAELAIVVEEGEYKNSVRHLLKYAGMNLLSYVKESPHERWIDPVLFFMEACYLVKDPHLNKISEEMFAVCRDNLQIIFPRRPQLYKDENCSPTELVAMTIYQGFEPDHIVILEVFVLRKALIEYMIQRFLQNPRFDKIFSAFEFLSKEKWTIIQVFKEDQQEVTLFIDDLYQRLLDGLNQTTEREPYTDDILLFLQDFQKFLSPPLGQSLPEEKEEEVRNNKKRESTQQRKVEKRLKIDAQLSTHLFLSFFKFLLHIERRKVEPSQLFDSIFLPNFNKFCVILYNCYGVIVKENTKKDLGSVNSDLFNQIREDMKEIFQKLSRKKSDPEMKAFQSFLRANIFSKTLYKEIFLAIERDEENKTNSIKYLKTADFLLGKKS